MAGGTTKYKLDDQHYLNCDKYCYWITAVYQTESGKDVEKRVSGYFQRFADVVENYIEVKLKGNEVETLAALCKEVQELKKEVRSWEARYENK